ncbi:MAG: hypothetical protein GXY44_13290 [Phycisphaerales bacterium]|nr:hypothetical protein [Phycisphaerales bacterium]
MTRPFLPQYSNGRILWTDYLVTNTESGKTSQVALRGWEPGQSYCSCPNFRKNTLGICKHVLRGQKAMRRKFSKAAGIRKVLAVCPNPWIKMLRDARASL